VARNAVNIVEREVTAITSILRVLAATPELRDPGGRSAPGAKIAPAF
jgi:hypothetical protein